MRKTSFANEISSLRDIAFDLSYNWHEKRKCVLFSTLFEWQKKPDR